MSGDVKSAFSSSATAKPEPSAKRPAPFSLRLSADERTALVKRAKGETLGSYIKAQLFGDKSPRSSTALTPAEKARLLAALGQSELALSLKKLSRAAEIGALPVDDETKQELQRSLVAVREMRVHLIRSLGLREAGR